MNDVITIYVHRNGRDASRCSRYVDPGVALRIDRVGAVTSLWVDLAAPTPDEARILTDVFHFHPLSVEDALSEIHSPKIEQYPGYLYLILHGIDFDHAEREFATRDVDFFLGRNYLVTVHDGRSRSIAKLRTICDAARARAGRGPGSGDAPDRRFDGRQLPAGDRRAGRARSTQLEEEAIVGTHRPI